MNEMGLLNTAIAAAIAKQGHGDLLMITDAGFAIPRDAEVIDVSLDVNKPTVSDVLTVLRKHFSVEKIILADQTRKTNPTFFDHISKAFGDNVEVETIDHSDLKKLSKTVKAIIRTGDFTAYGNVILVSGAGDRWFVEN